MWLRLKRGFIRAMVVLFMRTLCRIEVDGLEKLRSLKGKAIVVSNHLGRLDAGFAFVLINRPDVIMTVAEKYREWPIFVFLVKQLDLLWLDRFGADLGTLKETLRRLDRGGILLIAPEGTRSPTEAMLEGKPGAAYLAAKSGAPVVPVGVYGSEDRVVKEKLRKFQRPYIRIVVGEVFRVPPLPKIERDVFLRQQTDEMMARIAALLPERYRGVYADYPQVASSLV